MARMYAAALLDVSSSRRHIERLGRAHSLARHLDDFLTDLVNAGASGHTPRAYGEHAVSPLRSSPFVNRWLGPATRPRPTFEVASKLANIDTCQIPLALERDDI